MRLLLLLLLAVGVTAVDYPLAGTTLAGAAYTIDPLTNRRPVLLVFWASWCPSCVREMPALSRLHATTTGRLDVVSCTIDTDLAAARAAVATHQLGYAVLRDGDLAIADRFSVDATPTLVLIGVDGRERARGRTLGQLAKGLSDLGVTTP